MTQEKNPSKLINAPAGVFLLPKRKLMAMGWDDRSDYIYMDYMNMNKLVIHKIYIICLFSDNHCVWVPTTLLHTAQQITEQHLFISDFHLLHLMRRPYEQTFSLFLFLFNLIKLTNSVQSGEKEKSNSCTDGEYILITFNYYIIKKLKFNIK